LGRTLAVDALKPGAEDVPSGEFTSSPEGTIQDEAPEPDTRDVPADEGSGGSGVPEETSDSSGDEDPDVTLPVDPGSAGGEQYALIGPGPAGADQYVPEPDT
jgi:hypothetical protein